MYKWIKKRAKLQGEWHVAKVMYFQVIANTAYEA